MWVMPPDGVLGAWRGFGDFEEGVEGARGVVRERLVLDRDGDAGPSDVLLELARDQKVDLKHIRILDLAEQYLEFVREARELRLELAADYLVMAAWLAYLKSRLLLPETGKIGRASCRERVCQ